MLSPSQALWIALLGAAGALARYGLGAWVQLRLGLAFPAGTLVINVLGSLALGLVVGGAGGLGPTARLAVGVGFLGAFTTFSTFTVDTVRLVQGGQPGLAAANLGLSLGLGLLAAWAGLALARI